MEVSIEAAEIIVMYLTTPISSERTDFIRGSLEPLDEDPQRMVQLMVEVATRMAHIIDDTKASLPGTAEYIDGIREKYVRIIVAAGSEAPPQSTQ